MTKWKQSRGKAERKRRQSRNEIETKMIYKAEAKRRQKHSDEGMGQSRETTQRQIRDKTVGVSTKLRGVVKTRK